MSFTKHKNKFVHKKVLMVKSIHNSKETAPDEEDTAPEEETARGEEMLLNKKRLPEIKLPYLDSFKWGSHNCSKVGSKQFLDLT